ncbi:MAG: nitrous oxide reductase accessory protein NosL [Thiogranum sp.]|nr:nitrous oxide reductase accessory protein NosL [Thiogranum sp.]
MMWNISSSQSALRCSLALLLLSICSGCEQRAGSDASQQLPVAFEAGDECHVCGMIIANFPGPRGQAWVSRRAQPLKFCSTRDLFAWLLQPETAAIVEQIYVHDMAQTDWAHPEDTRLIDARSAWYVVGSERSGAMGPTPASFAARDAARTFAEAYGGRLLRFDEVTLPVLESMMPSSGGPHH